ncbi:uncharacterised ACR, COG2135 family protein [Janthinobacterium agaricidamnosum NBRC 102515 = DSM 9628]|uniref:Abasic site processing protein n=2 Tax=Janthinobacterium agaricidamnosum TaxID=55508 RepID=W0V963_9BURK|nr:uncharacterised ACR, COG2135 family protein [Janthinobacterium agaricidamnosum NBRC 102515 = DSM 9628]
MDAVIGSAAEPLYNAAPGSYRPLMHIAGGQRRIDDLHWGYQASWAVGKVPVAINARLEKVSNRYWAPLLKNGRAILPADGWYEWTGDQGDKQPWHIHRADHTPLFIAALAHFGPASATPAAHGFTLVTADAEGGLLDVHDRRPVVFNYDDAALWLDPDLPAQQAEQLARSMALGPQAFHWFKVDRAVGNVRKQGGQLILPAK